MDEFRSGDLHFIKLGKEFCMQKYLPQKTIIESLMSSLSPGDAPLTLPISLTIKNILEAKELILRSIDNKSTTILEIDENAQVDLSFVQLVVAARKYAETKARDVLLARPATGDLYDVLERGGFLQENAPDAAHFWLHQETV